MKNIEVPNKLTLLFSKEDLIMKSNGHSVHKRPNKIYIGEIFTHVRDNSISHTPYQPLGKIKSNSLALEDKWRHCYV